MLPSEIEAKYELRGTLGTGAMGVVYEALDRLIERRVAIKLVRRPPAGSDPEAEESHARFRREAQAAGRLSHPSIVGVFEYGENAEQSWIVMELVEGGSLKERLDRKERFPVAETVRLMEQICAALSYSHARGVVHRDIKPANIMLSSDGSGGPPSVKIADFGIARIENSSMTQIGTVMGTPSYMAPEQLRGETVDARADIWAAGVVLYQLLTGEKPFDGGFSAVMHKALHTEPPPPSALSVTAPRAFDAVVARALAKRPEERWPSAAAFALAIRAAGQAAEEAAAAAADATLLATPAAEATMVAAPAAAAPSAAAARGARTPAPAAPREAAPAAPAGPDRAGKGRGGLVLGGAAAVALAAAIGGWVLLSGPEGGLSLPAPGVPPLAGGERVAAPGGPEAEAERRRAGQAEAERLRAEQSDAERQRTAAAEAERRRVAEAEAERLRIAEQDAERRRAAEAEAERRRAAEAEAERRRAAEAEAERLRVAEQEAERRRAAEADAERRRIAEAEAEAARRRQAETTDPAAERRALFRTAAAAAAVAEPCSLLSWTSSEAGVTLAGVIRRGGEGVVRRALASRGVPEEAIRLQLRAFDGPYCPALEAIQAVAAQGEAAPRVEVIGPQPLARGELLRLSVAMPDYAAHLYVGYLMKSGEVAHLVPSRLEGGGARPRLGDPRPGFQGWIVDEPFGVDMVIVFASDRPIFTQRRPVVERLTDWVAALSARLEAMQAESGGTARVSARPILVETVPRR